MIRHLRMQSLQASCIGRLVQLAPSMLQAPCRRECSYTTSHAPPTRPPTSPYRFTSRPKRLGAVEVAASTALDALRGHHDEDEPSTSVPLSTISSSSDPSSSKTSQKKARVGALQGIPNVARGPETLNAAVKRAGFTHYSSKVKNEAERERNRAARSIDTLWKLLTGPLTIYLDGFPSPDRLHPFEAALLQLTVGIPLYISILNKVRVLRKTITEAGKVYAGRASSAPGKAAAVLAGEEGKQVVAKLFERNMGCIDALTDIARKLRVLAYADPNLPSAALVGAPNVGKSSIVNILSSGTPEVQNYPFTTRTIKMGHFYVDGIKHQVTDTPGLLARPDEERNAMENLTLSTLAYLPTCVMFVMDLTEECGTSVQDQWAIRQSIRQRFPEKPWIDIFTKSDLLEHEFEAADEMVKHAQSTGQTLADDVASIKDSVEFAARLPHAQRISSLTEDGYDAMKVRMIDLFRNAEVMQYLEEAAKNLNMTSPTIVFGSEVVPVPEDRPQVQVPVPTPGKVVTYGISFD